MKTKPYLLLLLLIPLIFIAGPAAAQSGYPAPPPTAYPVPTTPAPTPTPYPTPSVPTSITLVNAQATVAYQWPVLVAGAFMLMGLAMGVRAGIYWWRSKHDE